MSFTDALIGLATGAAKQYVKEDEKETDKQNLIDTYMLKSMNETKSTRENMVFEYELKTKAKLEERKARRQEFAESFPGMNIGEQGEVQGEGQSPQLMAAINAQLDEGNIGKAYEFALNGSKYKADEIKDRETVAESTYKDMIISYEGQYQPIDTFRNIIKDSTLGESPLGMYGVGKEQETIRLADELFTEIGESGRVEKTGKTTISSASATAVGTNLLKARNNIVFNPQESSDDNDVMLKSFKDLDSAIADFEDLTGKQFNPFSKQRQQLFPKEVQTRMANLIDKGLLPSLEGASPFDKTNKDTPVSLAPVEGEVPFMVGGREVIKSAIPKEVMYKGKRARVLGKYTDTGKVALELIE